MKYNQNNKSRFRILKGGKISLVVSALLMGSLINVAEAAETTINDIKEAQIIILKEDTIVSVNGNLDVMNNDAINITGTYLATVTNNGIISSKNYWSSATGININSNLTSFTITNNQQSNISATTNGAEENAYAIKISGDMEAVSSIENSGTIEAISQEGRAYGITTGGDIKGKIINNAEGKISAISNVIPGDHPQDAYGIYAPYLLIDSELQNSGRIEAKVAGSEAYGIYSDYLEKGSKLQNSGTISAISELYIKPSYSSIGDGDVHGIKVFSLDGDITNSGTIETKTDSSSAKAYGINVSSGWYTSSIINSGRIMSTSISTAGKAYGIYIKKSDVNEDDYLTIENSGAIEATINGEADKNAYSIKSLDVAVKNINKDAKLYGNLDLKGGYLDNSGLISLPHNANGEFSATVDNFGQSKEGILQIGLLTDEMTTSNSQLKTKNAYFEDGSTIDVNVLSASTNVELLAGSKLTSVVTARNSLRIEGALNITDNSALLDFKYTTSTSTDINATFVNNEEGAIHLIAVEANGDSSSGSSGSGNIENTTTLGFGNTSTKAAAKVLDKINSGNHPAMNSVFIALNTLPTNEAVAEAVASTTPVAASASAGAASQISNGIQGIVEMRQRANFSGGLNSGEEVFAEKYIWFKPFGSFGKQDDKDGMNGFDIKARGLGFGVDGEYASNQKVGLALFYTQADVDVNNMGQSSDLGVFSTLVYGNVPIYDNRTNFLYQLGYAWQKTESSRSIALTGDTANADYTTNTASIDLKVIRDYQISSKLLLQPMIEATYRNFKSPDYSETGAGVLNLQSDSFNSNEFILGLGTRAHYNLDETSKIIANINLGYDVNNKQQSITAAYEGASGVKFSTEGIDNGRWNYDLGLGYERDVKVGHNINFSYNYQGQGSTFENHVLSAKYVLTF